MLSPGTKCSSGHLDSKCTLAYGTEMNLWQIEQHGRRAVAKERKYQGTGITAPAPCLAARSRSKTGEGNQNRPANARYPSTSKLPSRLETCLPLRHLRKAAGNRKLKCPQDKSQGSKEGKGLSHPVSHQPAGQRGKEPQGTRVGPPHSSRPSLPPHPLLPTRAENTSSGSDLEPRWLGPKCR